MKTRIPSVSIPTNLRTTLTPEFPGTLSPSSQIPPFAQSTRTVEPSTSDKDEQVTPTRWLPPADESPLQANESEQSFPVFPSTDISPVSPGLETPSDTRSHQTILEKPHIRRTPSKVPGDYDPVTGYYLRKSDPDIHPSDVD